MFPPWIQAILKEGGLAAVAAAGFIVAGVFYRMWLNERNYNRDQAAANQSQALKMSEAVNKMADAGERQADAIDGLADEVQRTREEDLRSRLERKGAG